MLEISLISVKVFIGVIDFSAKVIDETMNLKILQFN
jgi:hypothetical protein